MLYAKIKPKNSDNVLRVLSIGRVSTTRQAITNIDAGHDYAERVLKEIWDGEVHIKRLGEQGSGMLVGRSAIVQACEAVASELWDLVVMEDLSKSYRNPRWVYAFVQDAVDHGVRVIALGDNFDTADENWEVTLATATLRHGLHIPDTRRRIRRTSHYLFAHGGMVFKERFGYRKVSKEDAEQAPAPIKGLRIARVDDATSIIAELCRLVVEEDRGGAWLADWLNAKGVALPKYATRKRWTGRLVLDLLRDPILCGLRQYPKVIHRPRFSDGGHTLERNPSPQRQHYPELAHISEGTFSSVVDVLKSRTAKSGTPSALPSPRARVRRSKSIAPHQHAECGACGKFLYPVGNGFLKCQAALDHREGGCWCHVQVDGERVRRAMIKIILERVDRFPGAREALCDAAWSEFRSSAAGSKNAIDEMRKEVKELRRRRDRLTRAVEEARGRIKPLVKKLARVERKLRKARRRWKKLEQENDGAVMPTSRDSLLAKPEELLIELARRSFEFGDLMRKIFTSLVIQPVQALDSGLVRPCGVFTLDLRSISGRDGQVEHVCEPETITIELFDPPVHIEHMPAIIKAKELKLASGEKASLSVLSAGLGINRMTVKRALGYYRLMQQEGLAEPYRTLREAPKNASRWQPSKRRGMPRNSRADAA